MRRVRLVVNPPQQHFHLEKACPYRSLFGLPQVPHTGSRYQCTVKGGREGRDVDALQLAQTCEKLGAGEILLNCIDKDGTNSGFDIELVNHIRNNVTIPVIASSGAGKVEHFSEVFEKTKAEAALAAGIFHREEVPIEAVKEHMREKGIEKR